MKRKIFVVDDHPVIRKGYVFLMNQEPDLDVCGEAGGAFEAMEKIPQANPDLVVVDLSLGGMGGLELIKHLQAHYPNIYVLVVSTLDESLYAERALLAGARGYVMKSEVDAAIVEAMRRILGGGFYLSEQMNNRILYQYQKVGSRATQENTDLLQRLSDRELEIFELIGQGRTTNEIADALLISPKTVGSHRARIKNKLAVDTTTELLQRATLWVEHQP